MTSQNNTIQSLLHPSLGVHTDADTNATRVGSWYDGDLLEHFSSHELDAWLAEIPDSIPPLELPSFPSLPEQHDAPGPCRRPHTSPRTTPYPQPTPTAASADPSPAATLASPSHKHPWWISHPKYTTWPQVCDVKPPWMLISRESIQQTESQLGNYMQQATLDQRLKPLIAHYGTDMMAPIISQIDRFFKRTDYIALHSLLIQNIEDHVEQDIRIRYDDQSSDPLTPTTLQKICNDAISRRRRGYQTWLLGNFQCSAIAPLPSGASDLRQIIVLACLEKLRAPAPAPDSLEAITRKQRCRSNHTKRSFIAHEPK